MTWEEIDALTHRRTLFWTSLLIAVLVETLAIGALGWFQRVPRVHIHVDPPSAPLIEAEIYRLPENAKLVEEKTIASHPHHQEKAISTRPARGATATHSEQIFDQENKTEHVTAPVVTDHGPIPVFSPRPVLPSYLEYQDRDLALSVDFVVLEDGTSTPRLVGSSGNEEIDAISLETLKRWKFQPAVKDGKPYASHTRIRVEVVRQ